MITASEQLPRRTLTLARLPSEDLAGPRESLQPLAAQLEAKLRADLERFDIRDPATLRAHHGTLLTLAQFRGDWAAVPAIVERLQALQDKPGPRATTGLLATLLAEQQTGRRDAAWMRAEVARRYGALNWAEAGDTIKVSKGQFELLNPAVVQGAFQQQVDVMARNMNLVVPEGLVGSILGARGRGGHRHLGQRRRPRAVQDHARPRHRLRPRGAPAQALLRPLGEAEARWPQLQQLVKGAMDLGAALDTEDARRLKQVVATLRPDQVKAFQEDLGLAGLYTHGTHVAGIAVAGNPFARVFTATHLWEHRSEPVRPSDEVSQRTAASYLAVVQSFR